MKKFDKNVLKVLKIFEKSGADCYIVGGAVRDALRNKKVADYDLASSLTPLEVIELFKDYKTIKTVIKYGTVTLIYEGKNIEITTFRSEADYKDNRHPDGVFYVRSIKEDLYRRDFTIKALAFNEKEGLLDLFGGKADIKAKIIRAVGNKKERFLEDALRILRAFRFASCFGYKIEEETYFYMQKQRNNLKNISKERISEELIKIINGKYFDTIALEVTDIISVLFDIDNLDITLAKRITKAKSRFKLPLFLTAASDYNACLDFLKISKKEKDYIKLLLAAPHFDEKNIINLFLNYTKEEIYDILLFEKLCGKNINKKLASYFKIVKSKCTNIKQLKINGNDILKLGIDNTEIESVKKALLKACLSKKIKNKKPALLKYINENFVR